MGPKVYNSIFTDFNERAIELDTRNGVNAATSVTNGYAQFANNLWWGFVTGSGSGNVNNTATNLGRFTVATNYWTDTSLTNLIVNPQLTGISRTNVGTKLDPRPASGSPALDAGNVRALPANAAAAGYVGAFGSVNWASDWTALGEYCGISAVGAGTPVAQTVTGPAPTPSQPLLEHSVSGTNLVISFVSETGVNYQLQSASVLTVPVVWTNVGAVVPGTGGVLTFTPAIVAPGNEYFRVVVP